MTQKYADHNQVLYARYFQYEGKRSCIERIWSEVFGDQYPAGLDHFGYVTRHDLEVMAGHLNVPPGSTLLDIGCGKGGPGLHLAAVRKLQLTGIDVIEEAVAQAQSFQANFELAYPAQFEVGEFYKIPLPDQSVDAVISIDSLWAVPNKIQALIEVKRVMKPGARFIFTQWDLLKVESIPLLELSGLRFVSREDTPDWKRYQEEVYAKVLEQEAEIREEMGTGADMLLYEAQTSPPYLDLSVRRIYLMES